MIQREWTKVTVVEYKSEKDKYGQTRTVVNDTKEVDMVCKITNQVNTNNPKYVDITMLGIIRDADIQIGNEVIINGSSYVVKYIIPTSRLTQVLMRDK